MRAIRLARDGADITVSVSFMHDEWVEVIRERADGPISHIVDERWIERRIREHVVRVNEERIKSTSPQ